MMRQDKVEQGINQDRGVIIIPSALLAKIDRHRDELSRAEFIEGCIDTLLEQDELHSHAGSAVGQRVAHRRDQTSKNVTRAEFDDFKKSIEELLRSCVECLPEDVLESLARRANDGQERFRQLLELLEE